jgi:hypothetical protein
MKVNELLERMSFDFIQKEGFLYMERKPKKDYRTGDVVGESLYVRCAALDGMRMTVVVPSDAPMLDAIYSGAKVRFENLRAKAWAPDRGQPILLWKADGVETC